MFAIDGNEWPVACKIERTAEIRASQISGLMLDKSYFNDVLGTYMQYTVGIAVPFDMADEYAALYEILTDPVDGHRVELPYNGGTVEITGRIQLVRDQWVRMPGDYNHWRRTTFTIYANHPTKYYSLSEALVRGRKPLPEVSMPEEGDVWKYTGGIWVYGLGYRDADVIAY